MAKLFCLICFLPLFALSQDPKDFPHDFTGKAFRNRPVVSEYEVQRIRLSTGVELEYAETGSKNGIPIVFLHGLSDSWRSFEKILPLLPFEYRAFAISQRGHGNSWKPATGYEMKTMASDLASFVLQKKLGRIIVAGHSMGGVVAFQFALQYPSLTEGVVLIDSDSKFSDNPGMNELLQEVKGMGKQIPFEFMQAFQKSTLFKEIDSSFLNVMISEGLKVPPSVFYQACKSLLETPLSESIKKLSHPVLIMWGDEDSICLWEHQVEMKRNIAHSELVIHEKTGHALHWENPERFVSDLHLFLRKNFKSGL